MSSQQSNNQRETVLYYLPEEHYIGVTYADRLNDRMYQHERESGKITDGYEVLCSFERRIDALWLEIMFHQRGYRGSFECNKPKVKVGRIRSNRTLKGNSNAGAKIKNNKTGKVFNSIIEAAAHIGVSRFKFYKYHLKDFSRI